jgi:ATP synthase subunit 6
MVPYTATITAQFILVLSITLPLFIGINLMGLSLHGFNLFYLIMPAGVPLGLVPVIAILELLSYFIRIISLTLRLSANMIAGHILMKIILAIFIPLPFMAVSIIPFVILELVVALLQAYVYITLLISYYQDILLPH